MFILRSLVYSNNSKYGSGTIISGSLSNHDSDEKITNLHTVFTMKSNNFARFVDHSVTCAEPHFCPTYDTIRPVLQWCD